MKTRATKKQEWEVWTVFENTGRPNGFIDSFESKEEANEYLSQIEQYCDRLNVGKTYVDDDGFVQWA